MPRKIMFLGSVATALALPSLAMAACLRPAERTAFDIRALQSQLMVVALACQQQDDYNAFVTRFRSHLGDAHRHVAGYYRRSAGAQHQRLLDQYITNLANNQMQVGITQGTHFCQNQTPLFAMAMAASNPAELARITAERSIPQPLDQSVCAAPATRSASAPARSAAQPPASRTAAAQPGR